MRYALFLLTFLYSFFGYSQETKTVSLNIRMTDDKIARSLAILPVYVYKTNEIEPFTLFGIDENEKEKQDPLVIKQMPNMTGIRDTGYTYIYFSGANNQVNQGYCLTLIGNYRRSRQTVYFYVDRNNNLDFSDDGLPDSLGYKQDSLVIHLTNLSNNEAQHHVKLTRLSLNGSSYSYRKLLGEHFKKHSGAKEFSHINNCYREQRLNTIGGRFKTETDSFTLALKDMNNDGIFNTSCLDKLYIGGVGEEIHTEEMSFIQPPGIDMYFEWNKKRYKILSIDPAGSEISFVEEANPELTKVLKVGKKIPKFSYINMENQKVSNKKWKKKSTYVFFWNEEDITDKDTMYLRKLHEEFGENLNVVALNHGDNHRNVRKYQYYERIPWPIAFSSYQIGQLFYLEESLTRGYLMGKRLKLKSDDISPEEVYNQLNMQN